MTIKLLDCTLRDGGYHNAWDFEGELVDDYLAAMQALGVDYVELGFRSLDVSRYRGPMAYTTDRYIDIVELPEDLQIGVMINAAELGDRWAHSEGTLERLFVPAGRSKVSLVRIACHYPELDKGLAAAGWLRERGYRVAVNLMQISQLSSEELQAVAKVVAGSPIDVLYFADSLGSLTPEKVASIVRSLRRHWNGEIGIHTHDNIGNAVANTLRAIEEGATWVDGTVTGMGRGAGNAKTEYLAVELGPHKGEGNIAPLLTLIERHFEPLRARYGWGTNFYYYLAGKYGIHPTYIQEMLTDRRYSSEDLHAVIEQLRKDGGRKFSASALQAARHFYTGEPCGTWRPSELLRDREVLVLGTGPGVARHRRALEEYVRSSRPFVVALNTLRALDSNLIDVRAACHPMRLLADCAEHLKLDQPLVTPVSMLPEQLRSTLSEKELLDFGLKVEADTFRFHETYCVIPSPLVMGYVLAICAAGEASRILLAGFDGYAPGDPRNEESEEVFRAFEAAGAAPEMIAVTPSSYKSIESTSIYGLLA